MLVKQFIFYLALTCVFFSCSEEKAPPPSRVVEVTTMTVESRTLPIVFEFVGVTQSSHLVDIRSRVEGYLQEIAYVEGSLVHAGELLFQIDSSQYKAALDSVKAELDKQNAYLWNTQQLKQRLEPLYKQNAASRKDLDDAISNELGAEAAVEGAKAKLVEAQLNLSYTTIKSPVTGLSSQSNFRLGALISPTGANGLLTTVSVLDPLWVNFSVSENELLKSNNQVAKGQLVFPKDDNFEVEVVLADGSTFPYKGKVDFANPSINPSTGTMSVRGVIPNPKGDLKPGQFVRVRVLGAKRPHALAIPQRAIQQGKNGMFVYVVNSENKAEMREIEAGSWYGEDWIVPAGLNPGDVVIVNGVNKVQQGTTVKIISDKHDTKLPEGKKS